jgi:hypothetical protein
LAAIFDRKNVPSHLFDIPELDFSADIFADWAGDSWFRLGAWTIRPQRNAQGIEDVQSRQSFLLPPGHFADIYEKLESVGNVINGIGKPGGRVLHTGDKKEYKYIPFHEFEFSFTAVVGEPLVFVHSDTTGVELFVNPDLWLFFELEERTHGNGIWWDPRRGVDALLRRVIADGNLEVIEIRTNYLLKYLQARQMSLIAGHYRHFHLFDPQEATVEKFVEGDVILGSPEQQAKALFQNWGLRRDFTGSTSFLQRRLHLWFEIRPPEIDAEDPWADQPPFDPYAFTLPTHVGLVAPARWKHFRSIEGRTFDGESCDFMDRIYFRQEVLSKYEGASGYDVADDGSVSCHHYWGLTRSTARIGNELISTAIGDFAEGVPFEEWPHWKQYAVEPPSVETTESLRQEQSVPNAINSVVGALDALNSAFIDMVDSLRIVVEEDLWVGSIDSLAGRQLKWVYPSAADDDEFLKRATLTSTLVIEALEPASMRKLLSAIAANLHMNYEVSPRPLGSRNLLQRLTLIAILIKKFNPDIAGIPLLVKQAEGKAKSEDDLELQSELENAHRLVRDEFAPLAFLYDLRTFGGLAHAPNKARASVAATQLGLPAKNWHRTDYLHLLNLITESLHKISEHLRVAANLRRYGVLAEAE